VQYVGCSCGCCWIGIGEKWRAAPSTEAFDQVTRSAPLDVLPLFSLTNLPSYSSLLFLSRSFPFSHTLLLPSFFLPNLFSLCSFASSFLSFRRIFWKPLLLSGLLPLCLLIPTGPFFYFTICYFK